MILRYGPYHMTSGDTLKLKIIESLQSMSHAV